MTRIELSSRSRYRKTRASIERIRVALTVFVERTCTAFFDELRQMIAVQTELTLFHFESCKHVRGETSTHIFILLMLFRHCDAATSKPPLLLFFYKFMTNRTTLTKCANFSACTMLVSTYFSRRTHTQNTIMQFLNSPLRIK